MSKAVRVITYGTYDMLHYGHIRLLERAKALGDYLIVGITSDDYDKSRGKINLQQSLMERIEAVRATGLADEIIVEEYDGQKIDDVQRYDVDIFAIGSDWLGKFDYLSQFCRVEYLDRTEGVSSSAIRASKRSIRLGLVGDGRNAIVSKYINESKIVNGLDIAGIVSEHSCDGIDGVPHFGSYDELLAECDAVYIISKPTEHYRQIKQALESGRHVLVESPIATKKEDVEELLALAKERGLVLMDAIKTAYATAYNRLLLIAKEGKIGDVISVEATCTSLRNIENADIPMAWNSICGWGPTAMLPVFQILGTGYTKSQITTLFRDSANSFDLFTHIHFCYPNAVATIKVGMGVKSEGELVISGTKGYIYVPAPWWKTDYFETRFEDQSDNKRYFYQLDGEGIRYELVAFVKEIEAPKSYSYISSEVSASIGRVIGDFYAGKDLVVI